MVEDQLNVFMERSEAPTPIPKGDHIEDRHKDVTLALAHRAQSHCSQEIMGAPLLKLIFRDIS